MLLKIPRSFYFDMPRISLIKYLEAVVNKSKIEDDKLKLEIEIGFDYVVKGEEEIKTYKEIKKISILVDKSNVIKKANTENLNFELVHNKGVEVIFDLNLEFKELDIVDKELTTKDENIIDNKCEDEKDKIEIKTDKLLEKLLETRDDNFLEINDLEEFDEEVCKDLMKLDESYNTIKIINVSSESDIERISSENNITVSEIYEQNSYKVTNRVKIEIDE